MIDYLLFPFLVLESLRLLLPAKVEWNHGEELLCRSNLCKNVKHIRPQTSRRISLKCIK